MPYENEHACRLKEPGLFERFTRKTLKHNGKEYDVIIGFKKGGGSEVQAFRYPKGSWSESGARAHCKDHDGSFEAAKKCIGCNDGGAEMSKSKHYIIEYKSFAFELKDHDEKGKFQGLLSTNGNIDPGLDRFNPGTWKRTIGMRGKEPFPLLKSHRMDNQVGSFIATDINEGLFIDAKLNLETLPNGSPAVPIAWEQYALYKAGDAKGLSVGFRPIEDKVQYPTINGKRIRDIFEAQLVEGSMTPLPMNDQAGITAIKNWNEIFAVILENSSNLEFKYKVISLLGYDPVSISTLESVTSTPGAGKDTTQDTSKDNIDWGEVYDLLPQKIKLLGGK